MTRGGASLGGFALGCLVCSSCVDREESRMYAGVANTSTAATAIKSVTRMLYLTTPAPVEIAARSEFDSALARLRRFEMNGRCGTRYSIGEIARRRPNKEVHQPMAQILWSNRSRSLPFDSGRVSENGSRIIRIRTNFPSIAKKYLTIR